MPKLEEIQPNDNPTINQNRCFFMPIPINTNIMDNLETDSSTTALSAKQGKVLKELIESKTDHSVAIDTSVDSTNDNYLKWYGLKLVDWKRADGAPKESLYPGLLVLYDNSYDNNNRTSSEKHQADRLVTIYYGASPTGTSDLFLEVLPQATITNPTAQRSGIMIRNENGTAGHKFVTPIIDNHIILGGANLRWRNIFSISGTISTSDEREKFNISNIPDEVLDAWEEVQFYQYQFNDARDEKGDNARYHTGLVAQRIKHIFEARNLDAFRYGLICHDKWDATPEQKDENGNIIAQAIPAGDRYSLRYEECFVMEAACQRRRADRMETRLVDMNSRLATLEKLLNK